MAKNPYFDEGWDNLRNLIDTAMSNPTVSDILRTKPPSEALRILKEHGLNEDQLAALMDGFEKIADRNSARFWSPLA